MENEKKTIEEAVQEYFKEYIENIWNEFVKEEPPINNGSGSDFLEYIKQFKKNMKLSKYTIARNCTDLSDIQIGIKELREYLDECYKNKVVPKETAYIRYSELFKKRDKLINK